MTRRSITWQELLDTMGGEDRVNEAWLAWKMGGNPHMPESLTRIEPDATWQSLWECYGTNKFLIWLAVKLWKRGL